MAKKIKISFNKSLERLNEIVNILDEGSEPLEKLISLFEEGMKITNELKTYLQKSEVKIHQIIKEYNPDDFSDDLEIDLEDKFDF